LKNWAYLVYYVFSFYCMSKEFHLALHSFPIYSCQYMFYGLCCKRQSMFNIKVVYKGVSLVGENFLKLSYKNIIFNPSKGWIMNILIFEMHFYHHGITHHWHFISNEIKIFLNQYSILGINIWSIDKPIKEFVNLLINTIALVMKTQILNMSCKGFSLNV
jgi:hypothetical protein